ncbi:pre-mRNA-splicing factor CWC25 -like protein [Brachionus plicatilis]|uniref:Pre-mRNA-splicing factor CWC25-like protein n=1 Tax=Brachionus plicatilis TaxID=10195 RepID=A0A3M7RI37_BRAPC|nr:pre-mRNA-splicing factor CWC25 -like protein [Brachionus plicatilis]
MSKKMQTIDPAERSKIARLQSEIKQESDKKIEWLYSGNKIDRDAYLLGRPINKLLIEKEQDESQQSQFQASTIDMENKIREDPLFEIKDTGQEKNS